MEFGRRRASLSLSNFVGPASAGRGSAGPADGRRGTSVASSVAWSAGCCSVSLKGQRWALHLEEESNKCDIPALQTGWRHRCRGGRLFHFHRLHPMNISVNRCRLRHRVGNV